MNSNCLYCFKEIVPEISWSTLFTKLRPVYLCSQCENLLIEIKGPTCQICNRPLEQLDAQYIVGDHCYDCERWESDPTWKGCLERNHSLYIYNDCLKELISRFKFRGDYILAKAFSEKLRTKMEHINYDLLVPIPLSKERQYERGFNQSVALILEAGFKGTEILERIHGEKQSKKSRHERIHLNQVFQLKKGVNVAKKRVLLVDDIYTTGSTLRHAAKVLQLAGAKSVVSLTLAR